MILLDQPYVSEFLKKTIRDMQLPVFEPSGNIHFDPDKDAFCLNEEEAIRQIRENPGCRIYTNSENAIHWISRNLGFTDLPEKITLFKDKFAFRKLTQAIYPELFFKEIPINSLLETDASSFPYPFVIKPSVGFFSLGVHTVNTPEDWEILKLQIHDEIEQVQHLYPVEVLDTASYIAEGYIEGDEYAFDAYFDDAGEPVLLNTWKHYFASREDVSDRVYVTSGEIVSENLDRMTGFLKMLAGLVELRNFPLHVEVRIDEQGRMVPIEVNPLRYGGWCTTADNTSNAFGFNAYEYFLKNLKPDWATICRRKPETLYSLIVLNNSTGIPGENIQSFDHARLLTHFHNPLEFRPADFHKFPLFGFIFTETPKEHIGELNWILNNDLREFIG